MSQFLPILRCKEPLPSLAFKKKAKRCTPMHADLNMMRFLFTFNIMDFNSYKEAKVLSYTIVPYRDPGQSCISLGHQISPIKSANFRQAYYDLKSGDFHHFSSKSAFANMAEIESFSYFSLRNKL